MVYCIFIDGFGSLEPRTEDFQESFGMFHNAPISFWSSSLPTWLIIVNFIEGLVPLPAVILSAMKRKNESEELVFVLAVLSLLPLVGSHANCIRFIGGVSTVYASWRCYEIGQKHSLSERII
jgi:hypothetical protein